MARFPYKKWDDYSLAIFDHALSISSQAVLLRGSTDVLCSRLVGHPRQNSKDGKTGRCFFRLRIGNCSE